MPSPEKVHDAIKALKSRISTLDSDAALKAIDALVDPDADYLVQARLARLFEQLPPRKDHTPVRLALLATSTVDHLAKLLPLYAALNGVAIDIFVGDFDTMSQAVLDASSGLYEFRPDVVWLFNSHRDIHLKVAAGATVAECRAAVETAVDRQVALWSAIHANSGATILQNNADLPEVQPFGNLEVQAPWGRRNLLTRYNLQLADAAPPGVVIFDLDQIAANYGRSRWFDHTLWHHSKHGCGLDASGRIAFHAMRVLASLSGKAKKCLVLDLDNTLWGGVIGDDGLGGIRIGQGSAEGEAYLQFQTYLMDLRRRGIVLAVSSKNEDETARLPFQDHPDMVLRLDDIAVFSANWENKADNIRAIAETLEIGLDSLVFFDDNPVERALVRDALPMVTVPEAPEDPALYTACLDRLRLFESVAFSHEDGLRADMYRQNAARKAVERQATDISSFLRDLEMKARVRTLDAISLPRSAQLINKSNQFHLTTTRYAESRLREMMSGEGWHGRSFHLADRFGDHGLISVVILRETDANEWLIDTWCMSCRVLARGMEEFVLNEIAQLARDSGAERLTGLYRPTAKNRLVAELYPRLGFAPAGADGDATAWALDLRTFAGRPTFIESVDD